MILSVIIPAHGRDVLLVRCLKSLDRSIQGDIEYEVCVVDDGSGLSEMDVREAAAVSYTLLWRGFDSSRGRSAARNEGVRATSGDIIVFLDSDMEARPGFLRAHRDAHRTHPHAAILGKIIWPKGGGFNRYIGSRGAAKLGPGLDAPPWYFVTGNASVERADLPPDRPFDEAISGWGGEDLALGLELAKRGVRFTYIPGAVSFHHFTGTLMDHVTRTGEYGLGSLPILVNRHPELMRILRLDALDSPVWRLLVSAPVFRPVYAAARLLDVFPLPSPVYDYLTFSAYARGFLRARDSRVGAATDSSAEIERENVS